MVMVPVEAVKLPETLSVLLIVKSLAVVAVPETVRLLKTRLVVAPPLLTMEPPVIVIVPSVGAKVLPLLTVKAPLTKKLDVG